MTASKNTSNPGPRNFLSRKEQRRLLAVVMGVGLVVLLISEARRPDAFWKSTGPEDHAEQGPSNDADFDTSYQPQPVTSDLDTVRIVPRDPTMFEQERYFPGVKPELLRDVEDYAPFRAADGKPWYHLLGILQESRSEELRQNSRGEVAFVQLYEQPDSYRGELVTLSGMAKRATRQSAAPNSQGIEGYYELVLQPLDGPLRPISIKVLELPEGFPVGEGIREDVELTGFFFKNLVYLAEDGNDYIMPVLLAKDVQWEPQQSQAERRWNPSAVVAWGMVGGLAILATLLSLLVYVVSNRIALPGRNSAREPIPGNFDALHREQVKTVEEKLDEMAGKDELPRNETQ